jgi:hypothetical protein
MSLAGSAEWVRTLFHIGDEVNTHHIHAVCVTDGDWRRGKGKKKNEAVDECDSARASTGVLKVLKHPAPGYSYLQSITSTHDDNVQSALLSFSPAGR